MCQSLARVCLPVSKVKGSLSLSLSPCSTRALSGFPSLQHHYECAQVLLLLQWDFLCFLFYILNKSSSCFAIGCSLPIKCSGVRTYTFTNAKRKHFETKLSHFGWKTKNKISVTLRKGPSSDDHRRWWYSWLLGPFRPTIERIKERTMLPKQFANVNNSPFLQHAKSDQFLQGRERLVGGCFYQRRR